MASGWALEMPGGTIAAFWKRNIRSMLSAARDVQASALRATDVLPGGSLQT